MSFRQKELTILGIGISKDITILNWNLLSHPALLRDPDLPATKKLRFSEFEQTIGDNSSTLMFVMDTIKYINELTGTRRVKYLAGIASMSDTIFNLLSLQSSYYREFSKHYRARQLRNKPHMEKKFDETYAGIRNQSKDLKVIIDIATAIRQNQN